MMSLSGCSEPSLFTCMLFSSPVYVFPDPGLYMFSDNVPDSVTDPIPDFIPVSVCVSPPVCNLDPVTAAAPVSVSVGATVSLFFLIPLSVSTSGCNLAPVSNPVLISDSKEPQFRSHHKGSHNTHFYSCLSLSLQFSFSF